jgi:hypothetical protein
MNTHEELILGFEGVTISFGAPAHDDRGWLSSYGVSLMASGFSASVRVENPGYGFPPSKFFSELAEKWRGWQGQIKWRSMEAELELIAASDPVGHIWITANVRPDAHPARWRATASVMVEAGQLQRLSHDFSAFFTFRPRE